MTTLTDRYVHAATRWLPTASREEVAAELRERIEDTVAARADGPDPERAVLQEMGDPLRLMTEYSGHEPRLIGPRYFYVWLRLLTVLVLVIPVIAAVGTAAVAIATDDSTGSLVGTAVATWFQVAVQVAFWTTLTFAILDWTGADAGVEPWSVDNLPEPDSSTAEFVLQVVFLVGFAAAVVWQAFASPITDDGGRIALIDPALWAWWLPLILALIGAEIGHAVWVHRTGWTPATAGVNAVIAVGFAAATVPLLLSNALLNPALVEHLGWDSGVVGTSLRWTAAGVVIVTAWEVVDGFRRAHQE